MKIEKIKRFVGLSFHIDTNCINAKNSLEYMNQLEKWHDDGVISLKEMSAIAQKEASSGGDVQRHIKANNYIYTETLATTDDEKKTFQKIGEILFPKGIENKNQQNDVEIVFNAGKYKCKLITNDGGSKRQPKGILGSRNELEALGIEVITGKEAYKKVKQEIIQRDKKAIWLKNEFGHNLPDWVGKD